MATFRQGTGQTKTIKAIGPTTREDGSALAVDEISHYIRYLRFENGPPIEQNVQLVEDTNTPEYDGSFDEEVDIDSQTPGVYEYWYRTEDTGGRQSKNSEILTLEILVPLANPRPPTGLSAY